MCVSFWLLDKHPVFWLVLALNRDETLARPSLPLHFWDEEDECKIVAGRDVLGGGTWLGITTTGRLAFLTNVREQKFYNNRGKETTDVISRGALPTQFFKCHQSPVEYLEDLAPQAQNYNGFNLVVADVGRREMAILSNRPKGTTPPKVHKLGPGLHAVSNGSLDSRWPKMERGKQKLHDILSKVDEELPSELIIQQVLEDRTKADDVSPQVAETGCPLEFEYGLSSIFVDYPVFDMPYGTRSMSVIGIRRDGSVSIFERSLGEGGVWQNHSFQFPIEQEQPSKRV